MNDPHTTDPAALTARPGKPKSEPATPIEHAYRGLRKTVDDAAGSPIHPTIVRRIAETVRQAAIYDAQRDAVHAAELNEQRAQHAAELSELRNSLHHSMQSNGRLHAQIADMQDAARRAAWALSAALIMFGVAAVIVWGIGA